MCRKGALIVAFLLLQVTFSIAQKVKYKDLIELLNAKQYEMAEPFLKRYLKENTDTAPEALLLTGMLNGLLPCGLVYAAAIGSTATGTAVDGALYMALFGLGTSPMLIAVRMGTGLIGARARAGLRRASPVMVGIVAALLVLRGLDLGIPYLSPAAPAANAPVAVCH